MCAASLYCVPWVTVMESDVKKHLYLLDSTLLFLWKQLLRHTTEMNKGQRPHFFKNIYSFHHFTHGQSLIFIQSIICYFDHINTEKNMLNFFWEKKRL